MKTQKVGGRQGDVLIIPVKSIPTTAKAIEPEDGRLIVARGEATGHHHSFPWQRGATLFRDDGGGSGGLYFSTNKPMMLQHQEHTAGTIVTGDHKVIIQRTMAARMVRAVAD